MSKKVFLGLLLFLSVFPYGQAATYYVSSSSGSDTNIGTSSSAPRKTLAGLSGKKNGNTILLKRGDIFFESISGFSNCTLGAYGSGDKPVLCGFTILRSKSSWSQESAGIWKLDMNASASFYGHGCNAADKYYGNIGTIYDPSTDTVYGNLVSSASELSSEGDFYTSGEWSPGNITSSTYRYLRMKSASRPGALCFATYGEAVTSMTGCTISDIAIVGFDDLPIASAIVPPLTTVQYPYASIAEAALSCMLDHMEDPAHLPEKRVIRIEGVRFRVDRF